MHTARESTYISIFFKLPFVRVYKHFNKDHATRWKVTLYAISLFHAHCDYLTPIVHQLLRWKDVNFVCSVFAAFPSLVATCQTDTECWLSFRAKLWFPVRQESKVKKKLVVKQVIQFWRAIRHERLRGKYLSDLFLFTRSTWTDFSCKDYAHLS